MKVLILAFAAALAAVGAAGQSFQTKPSGSPSKSGLVNSGSHKTIIQTQKPPAFTPLPEVIPPTLNPPSSCKECKTFLENCRKECKKAEFGYCEQTCNARFCNLDFCTANCDSDQNPICSGDQPFPVTLVEDLSTRDSEDVTSCADCIDIVAHCHQECDPSGAQDCKERCDKSFCAVEFCRANCDGSGSRHGQRCHGSAMVLPIAQAPDDSVPDKPKPTPPKPTPPECRQCFIDISVCILDCQNDKDCMNNCKCTFSKVEPCDKLCRFENLSGSCLKARSPLAQPVELLEHTNNGEPKPTPLECVQCAKDMTRCIRDCNKDSTCVKACQCTFSKKQPCDKLCGYHKLSRFCLQKRSTDDILEIKKDKDLDCRTCSSGLIDCIAHCNGARECIEYCQCAYSWQKSCVENCGFDKLRKWCGKKRSLDRIVEGNSTDVTPEINKDEDLDCRTCASGLRACIVFCSGAEECIRYCQCAYSWQKPCVEKCGYDKLRKWC